MTHPQDLDPSLAKRLVLAKQKQAKYRPSDDVADQLKDVTLGSLVGVTGIGKSYLIQSVIRHADTDFSEVGNISSRARRPSDPENFRGERPIEDFLDRIERGEMVNYIIHPSGDIYGTDIKSYTTNFVLLPTLTSSLEQFQTIGCFKRIIPIGLVADGASWEERLGEKLHDSKIKARIHEALNCIAWLQDYSHRIPILENKTGEEEETAQAIIDILQDVSHPHPLDNLEQISLLIPQLAIVATDHLQKLEKA